MKAADLAVARNTVTAAFGHLVGTHAHFPGRLVLLRDPADRAVGAMAIYVENERLAVLTSALRRAHQPGGDLFVPHRS